jgi:hypothetical protein
MSEYNTNPFLTDRRQQEKKRVPTEKELESLVFRTITKMQNVWLEYYSEYATFCGSTIASYDFPSPLEVCEQFTNFLTRNRTPDYPKRMLERSSITYGEYKRAKIGNDENFNANNVADDGWDESGGQVSALQAQPTSSFRSNHSDGDSRGRGRGRGNFRGNARYGGGDFRGGNRRENNWNDNNRKGNNFQNDHLGTCAESGWSDDDESKDKGGASAEIQDNQRDKDYNNNQTSQTDDDWDV